MNPVVRLRAGAVQRRGRGFGSNAGFGRCSAAPSAEARPARRRRRRGRSARLRTSVSRSMAAFSARRSPCELHSAGARGLNTSDVLIAPRVRKDRDRAGTGHRIQRLGSDLPQHVDPVAKQLCPGGAHGRDTWSLDVFDRRLAQVVTAVRANAVIEPGRSDVRTCANRRMVPAVGWGFRASPAGTATVDGTYFDCVRRRVARICSTSEKSGPMKPFNESGRILQTTPRRRAEPS